MMACKIRDDKNIKGFTFDNKTIKLSQYADDTTLILSSMESVTKALQVVTTFSKYSGLRLNLDKCEAVGLGLLKDYNGIFSGIKFTLEPIKCIGIFIGHNKDKCNELNWDDKISKFEKQLNHWKMRKLTLFGKILILKSLGISTLIYNMSLLETNNEIVKRINKITYDFIWRKKDRIKRKTIIGSISNGGISMIDIECKINSLKASWVFYGKIFMHKKLKTSHTRNLQSLILRYYTTYFHVDLLLENGIRMLISNVVFVKKLKPFNICCLIVRE